MPPSAFINAFPETSWIEHSVLLGSLACRPGSRLVTVTVVNVIHYYWGCILAAMYACAHPCSCSIESVCVFQRMYMCTCCACACCCAGMPDIERLNRKLEAQRSSLSDLCQLYRASSVLPRLEEALRCHEVSGTTTHSAVRLFALMFAASRCLEKCTRRGRSCGKHTLGDCHELLLGKMVAPPLVHATWSTLLSLSQPLQAGGRNGACSRLGHTTFIATTHVVLLLSLLLPPTGSCC